MPGRTDDDQLVEENEEVEETEETEETEESTEETTDDAAAKDSKPDKRVRDLQSKADAETARANKAEAALKALKQGESGNGGNDPATQALMTELREASLDAVFGEFPELRDYGIDRSLIEGTTRSELRGNAASLVGLIKKVETKARNKVLAENGIAAPTSGTRVQKPVDYASMSDEDFKKLLDNPRY